MRADILKIARLRMATDGRGVSTLVAFRGCPLSCKYCINDQCHEKADPSRGMGSGGYDPEELIAVLRKDDIYYRMTGGGVVFGGGEPLLQAEFIHEVCRLADPSWAKRIETSLYADREKISLLLDEIDEWIIDIKDMNADIYKKYTGKSNEIVLRNLEMLREQIPVGRVRIRVPLIPGYNEPRDVSRSGMRLSAMGFTDIEEFEYVYAHFEKAKNLEYGLLGLFK